MPIRQARASLSEESDLTTSSENETLSSSSTKSIRLEKTFVPHPSVDSGSSSDSESDEAPRQDSKFIFNGAGSNSGFISQSRKVIKCRLHLLGGLACFLMIVDDYRRFQTVIPDSTCQSSSSHGSKGFPNDGESPREGSWSVSNPWIELGGHFTKLIPLCADDKVLSHPPLVRLLCKSPWSTVQFQGYPRSFFSYERRSHF